MDLLKALLGFAVLSSPLWLILILLPVSLWIAVKVAKRFKSAAVRLAGGVIIFLALFFLPFADEIAGRVYFNYLCSTEAGIKVYRTVELPAEHWDKDGRGMFYDEKNGNFDLAGYSIEYQSGVYSSFFHIDNAGYKRVENRSGQVLGEVTNFMYWGGWIRRNLSTNNTATICDGEKERTNSLIKAIFEPKRH